jgi:hypothetical protein
MCWYSVELDETDEKLVSKDDEAIDNGLIGVVGRTKYQFPSVQTTFAVVLAKWKERTWSTSPLGELKSQAAKHEMALRYP